MNKHLQSILIAASAILAYLWLSAPMLRGYSLQAFALAILIFIVLKRLNKSRFWHLLPTKGSFEMVILAFAFLLLIGATGNIESYFYPTIYAYLFFLAMTTHFSTAIIGTLSVMMFHYALAPQFSSLEAGTLLTIPLMLIFFLFAKQQYDEAKLEKQLNQAGQAELAAVENSEQTLEAFIESFLTPKLRAISSLALKKDTDIKEIVVQLDLLENESGKIVKQIRENASPGPLEVKTTDTTSEIDQTAQVETPAHDKPENNS